MVKQLGDGTYGNVWKAINRQTNEVVSVCCSADWASQLGSSSVWTRDQEASTDTQTHTRCQCSQAAAGLGVGWSVNPCNKGAKISICGVVFVRMHSLESSWVCPASTPNAVVYIYVACSTCALQQLTAVSIKGQVVYVNLCPCHAMLHHAVVVLLLCHALHQVAIKKMKRKFFSWDECMALREVRGWLCVCNTHRLGYTHTHTNAAAAATATGRTDG